MMSHAPAPPPAYRGRFAPSPTGALHFGSLVAAVGCYLDARAAGGQWFLRIEDVDAPRTVPGAADAILRTLEGLGFCWDGAVVWQSRRLDRYAAALATLRARGLVYPCACTRREIADSADGRRPAVDGGHVYPGTCRDGLPPGRGARAWRLRVPDRQTGCVDRIRGPVWQTLSEAVGDFVLLRADGQYAYQLAVVVDDAEAGITDVVRGADLIDSTPRQIWLQECLGVPTPRYAHLPVATNAAGEKLSKQTRATPIDAAMGSEALAAALAFLGHEVPAGLRGAPVAEFWAWAVDNWQIARVPRAAAQCPLP